MTTRTSIIAAMAAAAFSIAVPASAAQVLSESQTAKLKDYFTASLEGKNPSASFSKKIKLNDVKAAESQVWDVWKEANTGFSEEKLPPLSPIANAAPYVWDIPAELEPNAKMPYYWGYKGEAEEYPLFLYLHGSGPKEHEFRNGLYFAQNFKDGPSVYFVPQIPNEGEWYRWWQKGKLYAWEKLLRQAFVSGKIDPDKVYFFGISEGGYGSQRLASYYADYLAGAGPMAGGEPLINAPAENLRNTPFSLRTGAEDRGFYRNILTATTAAALDSLEAAHPGEYEHWIELIPGRGHGIDYTPTTPWLLKHTRNPFPKHVTWENLEIDGQYRDAFNNIKVIERSNGDTSSRTRYDMDIEGNTVHLNVSTVKYTVTEKDPQWGIGLKYHKEYTPAQKGKVELFFNDRLVDLSKPVRIFLNGKKVFDGKLKPSLDAMAESCAEFGDPRRIFPTSVTVSI